MTVLSILVHDDENPAWADGAKFADLVFVVEITGANVEAFAAAIRGAESAALIDGSARMAIVPADLDTDLRRIAGEAPHLAAPGVAEDRAVRYVAMNPESPS